MLLFSLQRASLLLLLLCLFSCTGDAQSAISEPHTNGDDGIGIIDPSTAPLDTQQTTTGATTTEQSTPYTRTSSHSPGREDGLSLPPTGYPFPSSFPYDQPPPMDQRPQPRYPFSGDSQKLVFKLPGEYTKLLEKDPECELTKRIILAILTSSPFNFSRTDVREVKIAQGVDDEILLTIKFSGSQQASKAWNQITQETSLSVSVYDQVLVAVPSESPIVSTTTTTETSSQLSKSSITGIIIGCLAFIFVVMAVVTFRHRPLVVTLSSSNPPSYLFKNMASEQDLFASISPVQAAVVREDVVDLRRILKLPQALEFDSAPATSSSRSSHAFPDLDAAGSSFPLGADDFLFDESLLDGAFLASIQTFDFDQADFKFESLGPPLCVGASAMGMDFSEPPLAQNMGSQHLGYRTSFSAGLGGGASGHGHSAAQDLQYMPVHGSGGGSPGQLDSASSTTMSSPPLVPSPHSSDGLSGSQSPDYDSVAVHMPSSAHGGSPALNQRDKHGTTPLIWASAIGNQAVVATLLEAGADTNVPNSRGQAPLHIACLESVSLVIVRLLIKGGANVNCLDGDNCTPLSYASRAGRTDIVEALLGAGADPSIADSQEMTPIMHAVAQGRSKAVSQLAVADPTAVTARDRTGWTALHWAVAVGSVESTLALLRLQRVNVTQASLKDETPLHLAARLGNVKIMRLLLAKVVASKQSAVLSSLTDAGMSALSLAEQKGNVEMVILIQQVLSMPSQTDSSSPSGSQESEVDDGLGRSVPEMKPIKLSPSSGKRAVSSAPKAAGKAPKRSHDAATEDGSGDEETPSGGKKERRRNYMRMRRNEERDQIQCMEDKVSALEQENKRLSTATSSMRAEADRIRALLNGEVGQQRFPPSQKGWGESFV